MKSVNVIIVGFIIYVAAFIMTYGRAYNSMDMVYVGEKAVAAFLVSAFWPMYWSVQVWK